MANVGRGEASFVGPGEKSYHIVMDFNAYAEAEDAANMDLDSLLKAVSPVVHPTTGEVLRQPRIKHLAALLFGGLQAKHPGIGRIEATNLLDCPGAGEALAKAMHGSMPKPDESAVGKDKPAPGTGTGRKKAGRQKV